MNFATLDIDEATGALLSEAEAFCDEFGGDAVEEEWETGSGFNERVHLEMGRRGWLVATWPKEEGGAGLTRFQASLLDMVLRARHIPLITKGTTDVVLGAVLEYGNDEVKAELLPRVAAGEIRFCLGYTEPDGGSDLAAARTRAVRDGEDWVIDGQKMFTTGAQNAHYAFLVTRTNPDVEKHKGLTTFLCSLEGAEISPVHTLGGERTNMVFFEGHRIPDRFRLGPVDGGWSVLAGSLDEEHAIGQIEVALERRGGMYGTVAAQAVELAIEWAHLTGPHGDRPIDDPFVRARLAEAALAVEVATASPGPMNRIASSEMAIAVSADLLDLVGPLGLLPHGQDASVADGWLEYSHRFAQGTATYGGTVEVQRNLIAERFLGLPRSTPSSRNTSKGVG